MNICNLQMMQCFVCPPIQLKDMMTKESIRGLWTITKTTTWMLWTSKFGHEMKIIFVVKGCENPKWKQAPKKRKSRPLFQIINFFGNKCLLQQIRSLTICISRRLGVIFCKGLLTYVFYWKSMVEVLGFTTMWACAISISSPNGDWCGIRYGGKN